MKKPKKFDLIGAAMLKWYEVHARDFPWRRTDDPYAIWVSEIMLQQTQAGTMVDYYERFLQRFPDVRRLARAPLDRVLKVWEGLGYYSRARNLHQAAKVVVADYEGELPGTVDELRTLPGIGRYTAGAMASIAFGRDEPVLDGNVMRVLSRLFRVREEVKKTKVQKRMWDWAGQLVPAGYAGEFNQGMMELGATVCRPKLPNCEICPVVKFCLAAKHGEQDRIPVKKKKKPIPHYTIAAGVVWKRGRILIDQRKADGLLGGLWEFPGGKRQKNEPLVDTVKREIKEELDIEIEVVQRMGVVKHAYSHFRITLHVFECRYVAGQVRAIGCDDWKWIWPGDLERYAFPTANRKIIRMLMSE